MAAKKKNKNESEGNAEEKKTTGKKGAAASKKEQVIELPGMMKDSIRVRLVGISPLVMHAFGEKAKKEMRDKQQGRAKRKKEAKDPVAEYNEARYRLEDGRDACPTISIKKSLISACRMVEGVPMTLVRQVIHVNPGTAFLPIAFDEDRFYDDEHPPAMREDTVRVGGKGPGTGTADLRYRPEYGVWHVDCEISYLKNVITAESLLNLLMNAGFGCGIGENRPERTGADWGLFDVQWLGAGHAEAAE